MMRKLFISLLTLVALLSFAKPIQAHFLATDGNIGAVLHADPNDQPIAGSQASFFFEFKDKTNKFDPANCDCTFEVDENGENIYSQPLFQNSNKPSLTNASVFFTFPKRDVYQVKVTGKPQTDGVFQPFTLTWTFRVDQQASGPSQTGESNTSNFFSEHLIYFFVIGGLLLGFVVYVLSNRRIPKRQPAKGGEKKHDKKADNNTY